MRRWIAERTLLYATKGGDARQQLVVRVSEPYLVRPGTVTFPVSPETAACSVEITGLNQPIHDEVYGADLLQALQLAANVEPMLRRLSRDYDLYFSSGEPYFEDDDAAGYSGQDK
jgi:hypothetical protein